MRNSSLTRAKYLIVALAAATLAACGGSGYGTTQPITSDGHTVTATAGLTFTPPTLDVNVGQAVTFAFQSVAHNVFFDARAGAPADVDGNNANVSVPRTFTTAGTYTYTCHIHPSMHGTVVVH
jgi:plastocyanin